MEENLFTYGIPIATFLLGYLLANIFKSGKIRRLLADGEEKDRKYFELQGANKKQLNAKDETINSLSNKINKLKTSFKPSPEASEELSMLKDRNETLEKDLNTVSAKLKELKVEKAVTKVEEKYPMEMYGIKKEDERVIEVAEESSKESGLAVKEDKKKKKTEKTSSSKKKKSKKKVKDSTKSKAKNNKKIKQKNKKKKKKPKSKKQKARKILDLNLEANKTRRGLKIKKKKSKVK